MTIMLVFSNTILAVSLENLGRDVGGGGLKVCCCFDL